MRTPALIAKALGWPEARRAPALLSSGQSVRELRRLLNGMPYLTVRRSKCSRRGGTARWLWEIRSHDGEIVDYGDGVSQPAALALGLAALDTASVRSKR